ncbi:hypothetical protein JHK87_016067 [Glycine soja]|nr:hypothetical protein JHK87_016067 [Glycine soja]
MSNSPNKDIFLDIYTTSWQVHGINQLSADMVLVYDMGKHGISFTGCWSCMSPPRTEAGLDRIAWKGTVDGSFNLKSAYGVVCDLQVTFDINLFKLLHRWPGLKRIRMFLWKISHESILTNAKRLRIGISVNDESCACQAKAEALLHLFWDCNDCKQLWNCYIRSQQRNVFYTCKDWKRCLKMSLSDSRLVY